MYTPEELQDRIGYHFSDQGLLRVALTHSSYVKEHAGEDEKSNERLEFLGDAFFDAIIGEELFRMFPSEGEGFLSRTRAAIVCEAGLAAEAARLRLGYFLRMGNGEDRNGGRERRSILADALEALIGAVYMDGGYEEARRFVLDLFKGSLEDVKTGNFTTEDHKSALQEKLQESGRVDIRYEVVSESGPDHDKTFTVELRVNGEPKTRGTGKSKKKAEQQAAKRMMEKL